MARGLVSFLRVAAMLHMCSSAYQEEGEGGRQGVKEGLTVAVSALAASTGLDEDSLVIQVCLRAAAMQPQLASLSGC